MSNFIALWNDADHTSTSPLSLNMEQPMHPPDF